MFLFRGLIRKLMFGGLLLVVAAGAGWWFFIRSDAQLKTEAPVIPVAVAQATTAAAPAGTTGPALPAGTQRFVIVPSVTGITDKTEAAYFANEKLVRLPLPSTARGATVGVTGEIYLTSTGLDATLPTKISVDLKSLRSDESLRDGQVQRALQTGQFPTAVFTASKLTGFPASFTPGQPAVMQLTGMLDVHGVKKEVTREVKANKAGNVLTGLATVKFNFGEFNVPIPNIAGTVSVDDGLTLQVTIVAQVG
jgi:polyisoprenoid-binding protein YceI